MKFSSKPALEEDLGLARVKTFRVSCRCIRACFALCFPTSSRPPLHSVSAPGIKAYLALLSSVFRRLPTSDLRFSFFAFLRLHFSPQFQVGGTRGRFRAAGAGIGRLFWARFIGERNFSMLPSQSDGDCAHLSGVAVHRRQNVWTPVTAQGDRQAGRDENERFRSRKNLFLNQSF